MRTVSEQKKFQKNARFCEKSAKYMHLRRLFGLFSDFWAIFHSMKSMKIDINLENLTSKSKEISIWSPEGWIRIVNTNSSDQIDISLLFEVKYSRLMSNFMLFILWKIAQKSLKRPKSQLRGGYLALICQKRAFFPKIFRVHHGSVFRESILPCVQITIFLCGRGENQGI